MKINLMGDVMFAELLETYGRGLTATLRRTGADPFALVRPTLAGADLNLLNLECVLADTSVLGPPFSRILISPPECIELLVGAGINAVTTANNHALDHGEEAFARSYALLRERGIAVAGYAPGVWFQTEPAVVDAGGRRVGILGYNISNFPADDRDAVMARAAAVVAEARSGVDTLIVSVHWGEEYTNIPPDTVVAYGRRLLDAGCDIIHGHHSHQVQGVHNDGRRLFAPSLGNFIFDQKVEENRITAVLKLEVAGDGALAHEWLPCRMNDLFQPEPAPAFAEYLAELDAALADAMVRPDAERQRTIERRVLAGHDANRRRMRTSMIRHFWRYLPHLAAIRAYRRSPRPVFSVIVSSDSLPGGDA